MNIPESLVSKIMDGKCVLFLGAGATISSGGVLGSGLGKSIYSDIGDTGVAYQENLARYTQLLVNKGYREEIEKSIRKRFTNLVPSKDFACIANIPWKAIYTTNYDDLVEKSYKKQHFYNCIVNTTQREEGNYGRADVPLFKINGDINTPFNANHPLIITLNDLKDSQKTRKKILERLMKDLNDTFVFIGYSFNDENEIVTKLLNELSEDERWESVKEKYVVVPELSENIILTLQEYRINYLQGTGDEFLSEINQKADNNYRIKLSALKKSFSHESPLIGINPQTQQYIVDCFEVYNSENEYPVDPRYFYRGGRANWGIVKEQYDIARKVTIKYKDNADAIDESTDVLADVLTDRLDDNSCKRILIKGAAVSGKTTTLYRVAYDFSQRGIATLFYKQQAHYKEGLLSTIYDSIKSLIVVVCDDAFIDISDINKMITEAEAHNLPVYFIIATRSSDWYNTVSSYNRSVLEPFDVEIEMSDVFDQNEAENFVNKLIRCNLVQAPTSYEKASLIKKFQNISNIIEALFEVIDGSKILDSVADEYSKLCNETKAAYGIISLTYRFGYKIRWEVLQRTLNNKFEFAWKDFVDKIIKKDGNGNIYDDEIQGNYYLLGRNRFICEYITQIHYDGNYSEEIRDYKEIINACRGSENDERFVGGLINAMLKESESQYQEEYLIDILNHAIDTLDNNNSKSLIMHMKGEYYLQHQKYPDAISCFESNVQNGLNEEYSIHSLGKAYFYLSQTEENEREKFRIHIDKSIDKLLEGLKKYRKNLFYYKMLYAIYLYLQERGRLSEKNNASWNEIENLALSNIGQSNFDKLKEDQSISMD